MKKIISPLAPQPSGPYSQAVVVGSFLFVSSQLPLDPATGLLIEGGIEEQTDQVLHNIEALLGEVKVGWDQIFRVEIALTNLEDLPLVYKRYGARLQSEVKPVRQVIGCSQLPHGASVQIACQATIGLW